MLPFVFQGYESSLLKMTSKNGKTQSVSIDQLSCVVCAAGTNLLTIAAF